MANVDNLNLKVMLENAHVGVVIHRWDTSIAYANPIALKHLGLSYDQIIEKTAFDPDWKFVDEAGKTLSVENYPVNKVIRTLERLHNEVFGVIDSSEGSIRWFMVNAYHEGEANCPNSCIVVTFNDISDSKNLFSFKDIVENTQDLVIVTEASDIEYPTGPKIVYVNHAVETLTGYRKDEIIGETPRILQGALTDSDSKKRINLALKSLEPITETLLNYDIKGRPYWIEMNIIPLKNKYDEVTHFAAIERDVSERKFHLEQLKKRNADLKLLKNNLEELVEERTNQLELAKSKLEKIAYFDPLTNIPNRRYFIDQIKRLIKSCQRRKLMIAFGILDIDDFKKINDEYGHDAGDIVLKILSNFISHLFRADDAYCRYGGEEFAFAVPIEKIDDLERLADRLVTGINALSIDVSDNQVLHISASVGIKLCKDLDIIDSEFEIKKADTALYQSKDQGKDKYTIITE